MKNALLTPVFLFGAAALVFAAKKEKPATPTALDRYIEEAMTHSATMSATPGSLWSVQSPLTNLGSDVRAARVDDLVTIVVAESASAVAQGATKAQRQSSAKSSIAAAGGIKKASGAWANLADVSTNTQLDGQGTTTRSTQLSTTLSARVTQVLPNGYLVVEGNKEVSVNSEHQTVTVRGVVRPADLTDNNVITSNKVAQLEIKINGKGVVADAVRRPFILYRILLGLLPF